MQIAVDDQSSSSVNAGVGFAVPSDTVKTVVDSLIAGKAVQHAYLGVSVGDSHPAAAPRSAPSARAAPPRPQA